VDITVIIPLVFAAVFLLILALMLGRIIYLVKKNENGTAEDLGEKLNPYLYATAIVSVLMAICMIIATVLK